MVHFPVCGTSSEQSQDSVAALSDSSSLQDVFMDPTSSQDSTHKLDSGKCQSFSEDMDSLKKDKAAAVEEPGSAFIQLLYKQK